MKEKQLIYIHIFYFSFASPFIGKVSKLLCTVHAMGRIEGIQHEYQPIKSLTN